MRLTDRARRHDIPAPPYTRLTLREQLRVLGVLNNKHVPLSYRRASLAQRLALLQGLMDTDGYIAQNGACEFTNCRREVAEGVAELVMSLGMKTSLSEGRATIGGRDVGEKYRVCFHAPPELAPFRLGRKLARHYPRHTRRRLSGERRIVDVVPIASVPVRCITVDAISHLYLAGLGMIPTHNSGKTPLAGGIGLYGLTSDGEAAAEIYAAAVTRDQANILWRDARRMVEKSPDLHKRIQIHVGNLAYLATDSFFRPLSSEAGTLDGKRVHIGLIDEVHEHPSSAVIDKIAMGTKGRLQSIILEITNSGFDKNSVCWHHHEYSEKVLKGIIEDDGWFAYVCGLDPCDKCWSEGKTQPLDGCKYCDHWTDESVWLKANPCLGISITHKYLQEQVREAIGMPSKENIVKRLNFCLWTEQNERWMPMDKWDECGKIPVDAGELRGRHCYAGLDLSTTTDISAFVLVLPDEDGGCDVLSYFWVPEENIRQRSERDRVPYDLWVRQGYIKTTPGNVIDYDVIRKDINQLREHYDIRQIAIDRWNSTQLQTQLDADGFDIVPFGQGFASMSAPTKHLEKLVFEKAIRHGAHPVLRWMASNVAVQIDAAANIKPAKDKSTERIDGIVSLIMSLDLMTRHGDETSVYETRGVLMIG